MAASLTPEVFQFLEDIKVNNNRDWFNAHKDRYKTQYDQFKKFAEAVTDEMKTYDEIESHKVFRIYRDVRFSKDKSPYKSNFSGFMVRATKWKRGGYYFHLEPGNTFIAGGFWQPNSADLKRIRQEIAADDQSLRKLLAEPSFIKTFGALKGDKVKTAPKGFSKDHPAIDLLRYKQYLLVHNFTDKEAVAPDFAAKLAKTYSEMLPFLTYMSDVLTTDVNGVPIED